MQEWNLSFFIILLLVSDDLRLIVCIMQLLANR